MKALQIIKEGREAPLYHGFKEIEHAIHALKQNKMEGRTAQRWWPDKFRKDDEPGYYDSYWMKGISLTRSPSFAAKWGMVVFELDQQKLANNWKIKPHDWGATISQRFGKHDPKQEAEEFLITKMTRDKYQDPIEDDSNETFFNVERFRSPEGKPVEPLNKYLTGIYISKKYLDIIKKYEAEGKDKEYIEEIKQHPKYKGIISKQGKIVNKGLENDDFNIRDKLIYELMPGSFGWININTNEYVGIMREDLPGEIISHGRMFLMFPDIFGMTEYESKELKDRIGMNQDAHPLLLRKASDLGWVRVIHRAWDEETTIQAQSLNEIVQAARLIEKQDYIDVLGYEVVDTEYYGFLEGRKLKTFLKTGKLPRETIHESINWAIGSNIDQALLPVLQQRKENTVVWANIKDLFNHTEKEQTLNPDDPTGGKNKIANRVERNIEKLKHGEPMDPAEIVWNDYFNKISFQDGRHRLVAAYQLGYEYAPVIVNKNDLGNISDVVKLKQFENLNESVPSQKLHKPMYDRLIKRLKPIANNKGYRPGDLRLAIDQSVQSVVKQVAFKEFGIPKDYDLDVKVVTDKDNRFYAFVKYLKEEDAIILTLRLPKKWLVQAVEDIDVLSKLASNIIHTVIHEFTHVYQRFQAKDKMHRRSGELGKFSDPNKTIMTKDDPRYYPRYLADKKEIEAHAAETVSSLSLKYKDVNKAYNEFKNNFSPWMNEIIKTYWKNFAKNSDSRYQRVWRRFLKKVHEHFQQRLEDENEN